MQRGWRRAAAAALLLALGAPAGVRAAAPEKDELKLGFIKLTDCAPLVIAKELGFFEEEGLYVTLEAQANWKILMDRVIGGELDGAAGTAAASRATRSCSPPTSTKRRSCASSTASSCTTSRPRIG